MTDTTDLTRLAAGAAIAKMFRDGYLSICTIDEVIKTFNVTPEKEAHQILRLLHCVNFRDMPAEVRKNIPDLLARCFQGMEIDRIAIEQLLPRPPRERDITPEARRGGFLSFLGGKP